MTVALKIVRGRLVTPAANPLDDYRNPAQRAEAAEAARTQQDKARQHRDAAAGFWRGRRT